MKFSTFFLRFPPSLGCLFLAVLLLLPSGVVADDKKNKIEEKASLRFGSVMSASSPQTVTVGPEDAGAAVFEISGEPHRLVTLTVRPRKNAKLNNGKRHLKVNQLVFNGSITDRKGQITARLDAKGELSNVRVGGSVLVPPKSESGTYVGRLVLEVEVEDD